MDKNLQQLQHLQDLQDKVISLRSNTQVLKDFMNKTYTQELNQLLNVEINIQQTQVNVPANRMLDLNRDRVQIIDADEIRRQVEDCNSFLLAMQTLK